MKVYIFPPAPLRVLTSDHGEVMPGVPATSPDTGEPCQSFTIPDSVPNAWGAWLTTVDGSVPPVRCELRWGMYLPNFHSDTQAGLVVETFWNSGVPPVKPWPPVPSRDDVIGITTHFLGGLLVEAPQFGKMPWWDPCLPWCDAATRQAAYTIKRAAGDRHITFGIPCGLPLYNSGDNRRNFYNPARFPALDWTNGLTTLAPEAMALISEVIAEGFLPFFAVQEEMPTSFAVMRLLTTALQADSREPWRYAILMPGFDGVFYGWPDAHVNIPIWSAEARQRCPGLALALEFNPGHIPLGQGVGDYAPGGLMQDFDTVLGEFPTVVPFPAIPSDDANNVWEILRRCVQPYHPDPRDPNQGSGPFYILPSSRGPRAFVGFETWNPYNWVRVDPNNGNEVASAVAQIQAERDYFRARGCRYTG